MSADDRFRINSPNVIHEVIDDEAVVVDMKNGTYYSLEGAGADIWSLLERGDSVGQVVDALAARFSGGRETIEAGVQELVSRLREEKLIVPETSPPDGSQPSDREVASGEPRPFQKPALKKYTDMEELLLLDPIHDVEKSGWPNKAESTKA